MRRIALHKTGNLLKYTKAAHAMVVELHTSATIRAELNTMPSIRKLWRIISGAITNIANTRSWQLAVEEVAGLFSMNLANPILTNVVAANVGDVVKLDMR